MKKELLAVVLVSALTAGCRIEKASSGRPPGAPTEADSLAAVEQDSATLAQVDGALRDYYEQFSRGDWSAWRGSFWPGAVITTRATPPGESRPRVWVQNLDEFIRRSPDVIGRLPVFSERMLHLDVRSYGDLAEAWVVYERRSGRSRDSLQTHRGVDAFHLYRNSGQWRISSLTYARELPGRSLVP